MATADLSVSGQPRPSPPRMPLLPPAGFRGVPPRMPQHPQNMMRGAPPFRPPGQGPFPRMQSQFMHPNGAGPMRMPVRHNQPADFDSMENAESTDAGSEDLHALLEAGTLWVETKAADGKVYYYNAKSRESAWEKPSGGKVITQQEVEKLAKKPNPGQSYPGHGGYPMGPPMHGYAPMPRPGPWGGPYGAPGGAAGPYAMPCMAPFAGPSGQQAHCPWVEYKTGDGRAYFHNGSTGETTWEKPKAMIEAESSHAHQTNGESKRGKAKDELMDDDEFVNDNEQMDDAENTGTKMDNSVMEQISQSTGGFGQNSQPAGHKKDEKARPISSNPVAGTPWCVVWTGDLKVFFYNPSTRSSVWERPSELYNRPDVDLIMSKPPDLTKKEAKPAATSTFANKRAESTEPDADNEMAPTKKKRKTRAQKSADNAAATENSNKQNVLQQKETSKGAAEPPKIIDAALEAQRKAAQQRAEMPLELRVQQFRDLLREKEVSAFSTWEKELQKIVFDSRYLLLTSEERKKVFEQYVKDRAEEERAERKKKIKEAKEGFRQLLQEANMHGKSSFGEFTLKYGKDARFKAMEKSKDRESMFSDLVSDLRKKERDEKAALKDKLKTEFMAMLKENGTVRKTSKWSEIKKILDADPRYKQVESSSQKEDWFKEYQKPLPTENSDDEEEEARKERLKEKDQLDREKVAQKARVLEVAAELESHLKDRDKEIERHKYAEAEEHFKAMLADLVKNVDQSWRDWKRDLRRDERWQTSDLLDRHEKERLFEEHIKEVEKRKREAFYQLLNEQDSSLNITWKEIKKLIKDDPRYAKFSNSERKCEREFREYLHDKMAAAKDDFRDLLKETKIITYKSKQMIQDNEQHLKDILSVLENDKRYLILESSPDEREKLLENYLDELDKRGPPPPPTATESTRRK